MTLRFVAVAQANSPCPSSDFRISDFRISNQISNFGEDSTMILFSIGLFLAGVFLSAFFSGNETGFYRASRVKIVIDGLGGDRIAQSLLRLTNNPTLFVATTLVGNNVANYITSLAVVLLARALVVGDAAFAEMISPILLSPFLFVYGELLPKYVFYNAPNRYLRRSGPVFLFFTVIFFPVSAVLWSLARLLEKMLGQSPDKVRLALARKELQEVLEEGQEAGILHPTQRLLAQHFFLVASNSVGSVCTPLARATSISQDAKKSEALHIARRHKLAEIPLYDGNKQKIVGYIRTIDLLLDGDHDSKMDQRREMIKISQSELFGEALLRMQTERETISEIVADDGTTVGVLSIDQLTDPLLKGPLGSLRR